MTTFCVIDWYKLPTWFNYRGQVPRFTVVRSDRLHPTARKATIRTKYRSSSEAWIAASLFNATKRRRFSHQAKKVLIK